MEGPLARPRESGWRLPAIGPRARGAALAAAGLLLVVSIAAYLGERPGAPAPGGPAVASRGTALLGTATCATWQTSGAGKRLTIVNTLAAAATQPDPENPGATLSQGTAYGLFQRVCSTNASRSVLLYESYNRAASMSAARMAVGSGWGPTAHP
ncbi:MAG TPA: hypothetical protein VH391_04075 [Solirubrobacterales bacterium]